MTPSPVAKTKHALLAVLHALQEGPHVVHAANALQTRNSWSSGRWWDEGCVLCRPATAQQVGQAHQPCSRIDNIPAHRPAPHLKHAQHGLVGTAVQGPVQRAHSARHHCNGSNQEQRVLASESMGVLGRFVQFCKLCKLHCQSTKLSIGPCCCKPATHPCTHPRPMRPGAAPLMCCRTAGDAGQQAERAGSAQQFQQQVATLWGRLWRKLPCCTGGHAGLPQQTASGPACQYKRPCPTYLQLSSCSACRMKRMSRARARRGLGR